MPIPVTCKCGQSFAAGDHLAGRTVQCPKCKSPLAIPNPQAAAAPAGPTGGFGAPAGPSIFDSAGMKARTSTGPTCPSCSADLPPNAVLCVKCGYHLQLQKKIGAQTSSPGFGGGHGGHGDATQDLLSRAAQSIDEAKAEDRKALKEGMPWWALAGIFLFCMAFLGAMLYLPSDQALFAGGWTISIVCGLVQFYHLIRIYIIAFKDNIGHGLGCLFCGCYTLVYSIMHWDECGGHFMWAFIMNLVGNFVGGGMVAAAPLMAPGGEGQDGVMYPAKPPIVVAFNEVRLPRPNLKPSLV